MKDIYIDPNAFQAQIDSFTAGVDQLDSLEYQLDSKGLRLDSIDKYIECIQFYNETMNEFVDLLRLDAASMQQIKSTWMNTDSDIAGKTFGQVVRDAIGLK